MKASIVIVLVVVVIAGTGIVPNVEAECPRDPNNPFKALCPDESCCSILPSEKCVRYIPRLSIPIDEIIDTNGFCI